MRKTRTGRWQIAACEHLIRALRQRTYSLADAVSSRDGLQILLRVEVRVVQNDGVRGGQVDADATSSSRDEKDRDVRVGSLELVDS